MYVHANIIYWPIYVKYCVYKFHLDEIVLNMVISRRNGVYSSRNTRKPL